VKSNYIGRKPVPIKEYIKTRIQRLKTLENLTNDKFLSVEKRKRYRAQKFAL